MDENLLKLLKQADFSEKQAKVYLALLELSRGKVVQISKITDLKRSIIYVILDELIKKGYVSQLPNKKINEYQAIDPSAILRDKKLSIKNFSEMLPFLQSLHNKGGVRPHIHYIEDLKGIRKIYNEMSHTKNSFFISSYSKLKKHFSDTVEQWLKDYKKGHYESGHRHLIPDNTEDIKLGKEFLKAGQKVRKFSGIKNFDMDFSIYKNKLAITSLEDNPFMVLIESQSLVDSMKPIFELVWKAGKQIVD